MLGMNDVSLHIFLTMSQFTSFPTSGRTIKVTASMAIRTPSGGVFSIRSSSSDFLSTPFIACFAASRAGSTSSISAWILTFFSLITADWASSSFDSTSLDFFFSSASPWPCTIWDIISSAFLFCSANSFSFTASPCCSSATCFSVSFSFLRPPSMCSCCSLTSSRFSFRMSRKWFMKSRKSRGVMKLYFCADFLSWTFTSSTFSWNSTMTLARASCFTFSSAKFAGLPNDSLDTSSSLVKSYPT
mmetsp:Transcript_72450/g.205333  ORF Transcript_72450/g.205333 Transcript_72450/m.205333 type:complete len:244 (+) Transcript_72450:451-1182(+)